MAAMFVYTELGAEGKGDECPVQLSLEQTTTGDIGVNQNVGYKLTATVSLNDKNLFNRTALTQVVEDENTKNMVQISRASVRACSKSSVCDAFRKGNNSRVSEEVSANFTDGKASFAPSLNFSSPDTYTVFAFVIVPGQVADGGEMRFVAYTTTTVGSKSNATNSEDVSKPDGKTLPSSSPPKEKSAAGGTRLAATVAASLTLTASLLVLAF
jgi:hypothetical protein